MAQSNQASAFARFINLLGPFLGLLLVVGLFGILERQKIAADPTIGHFFLTGANFKIIFTQSVIVAIGALGMTIIIVAGGIDLSVGSVVALTSVAGAVMLLKGHSALVAAGTTVAVGALIGAANGIVIGGFRMMPFIVTLGMMGIARGTAKWLSGSATVNPRESGSQHTIDQIENLMASRSPNHLFPLPLGVWITIGLALLTTLLMRQTVFGRYTFAIGANEAAARLSGIRVGFYKAVIYTVAGVFVGISGLMQFARLTQGDPTGALSLELDIIAAVVIGGASLSGGSGSILGSMIGALIMAVLRNGSNQMEWPTYMQEIIIGLVIIIAVGADQLRQKARARA
jgi:ribose transport system permease protein